jgi:hypothetical protein
MNHAPENNMLNRNTLIAVIILLLLSGSALAHHGWRWTSGNNIELTGNIIEVELGNPHGVLKVQVEDEVWTIEVGQPWRNERAGLKDGDLAPGVEITVSGEPAADTSQRLLKAERLWLNGNKHELYPERD